MKDELSDFELIVIMFQFCRSASCVDMTVDANFRYNDERVDMAVLIEIAEDAGYVTLTGGTVVVTDAGMAFCDYMDEKLGLEGLS